MYKVLFWILWCAAVMSRIECSRSKENKENGLRQRVEKLEVKVMGHVQTFENSKRADKSLHDAVKILETEIDNLEAFITTLKKEVNTNSACCEMLRDPCYGLPCQNGGTCKPEDIDSYFCECPPGFIGYDCQNEDPCYGLPCQNGGTCKPEDIDSYFCECPPGFIGYDCQNEDLCYGAVCQNGGTCNLVDSNSYQCECPQGYNGKNCETEVAEPIVADQYGGSYNSETGILMSPNYPDNYDNDASCIWIITVAERETIILTFTFFSLEPDYDICWDYVEVRDGSNQTAPLLGQYCYDIMPDPVTTTGNTMYVEFGSDPIIPAPGFRATWAATVPDGP